MGEPRAELGLWRESKCVRYEKRSSEHVSWTGKLEKLVEQIVPNVKVAISYADIGAA